LIGLVNTIYKKNVGHDLEKIDFLTSGVSQMPLKGIFLMPLY